jgi:capsule polysaccharide modification protein KpsS
VDHVRDLTTVGAIHSVAVESQGRYGFAPGVWAGKPVKTLGQAVYNVPGLVFQGPLDEFWRNAEAPIAELRRAYIKALSACIQVKGGFFSESGLSAAVEEAALRLDKDLVNHPLKRETL